MRLDKTKRKAILQFISNMISLGLSYVLAKQLAGDYFGKDEVAKASPDPQFKASPDEFYDEPVEDVRLDLLKYTADLSLGQAVLKAPPIHFVVPSTSAQRFRIPEPANDKRTLLPKVVLRRLPLLIKLLRMHPAIRIPGTILDIIDLINLIQPPSNIVKPGDLGKPWEPISGGWYKIADYGLRSGLPTGTVHVRGDWGNMLAGHVGPNNASGQAINANDVWPWGNPFVAPQGNTTLRRAARALNGSYRNDAWWRKNVTIPGEVTTFRPVTQPLVGPRLDPFAGMDRHPIFSFPAPFGRPWPSPKRHNSPRVVAPLDLLAPRLFDNSTVEPWTFPRQAPGGSAFAPIVIKSNQPGATPKPRAGGAPGMRHQRKPPGKGTKERKSGPLAVLTKIGNAFGKATELNDAISVAWDALPPDKKKWSFYKGKPIRPSWKKQWKQVYEHWPDIDVEKFALGLVENHIEDEVIGRLSGGANKAVRKWSGTPKGINRFRSFRH